MSTPEGSRPVSPSLRRSSWVNATPATRLGVASASGICGIIATSQGWLVYGCWLRIAGFRGGEPRLRVEAEDACGLEAFTRAGVRGTETTHRAALG